ncbi:two-component system sensor histidine kinase DesK [Gracilibacillus halotolerans]|uniref:histidine kinase n=1 Tax=Gracilibacillus halotolerans TaxID=74386 RepID=A0A841RNF6_9BACI|nr:two-component system sensor histidine kinase DesK [Gracilibacillus halotolerans]
MRNFQLFPERYGFLPYVFLVYLAMPIYYVSLETGVKAFVGYALILLFFISYRQLYWLPTNKKYSVWLGIQLGIIIALSIAYNPYHLFLGFFPAHFIGYYEEKKHFKIALITFAITLALPTILLGIMHSFMNILFLLPFLIIMLISPYGIRSMNARMALEEELEQANEQIRQLVKREERVRIARDLHDTLGHTLSLITLQSQLVQRLVEKQPDRAREEAKGIEQTSRTALRQVRELVSNMRAVPIEEGLMHMEQILQAADIKLEVTQQEDISETSSVQQNIMSMCLKEAGTNIVKHSQATSCSVEIQNRKGYIYITVEDNGIGMHMKENNGNGIQGMKERLSLIEGQLAIVSSKEGTTLKFTIPMVLKQVEMVL